jgi:hypothetical protein
MVSILYFANNFIFMDLFLPFVCFQASYNHTKKIFIVSIFLILIAYFFYDCIKKIKQRKQEERLNDKTPDHQGN